MKTINKILVGVLAIAMMGCKEESDDTPTTNPVPKTLQSKYCAPSANTLEYKKGKYWFYVNGSLEIETEGGYSNGVLALTATVSIQGQPMDVSITGQPDSSGQYLGLGLHVFQNGQLVMSEMVLAQAASECPEIDIASLPQIAGTSFDLSQVDRLTRFRSSYGHSYTDDYESCRSMKHYFEPKQLVDRFIKLYAPFKARVVALSSENDPIGDDGVSNQHIVLQSVEHPALEFNYFHIELDEPLILGSVVEAGTELGWGDMFRNGQTTNSIDIAVAVNSTSGFRLVSMFDVLSDDALAEYNAWSGLSTREDYQISKADRDANPIQCNGETFVDEHLEPFYGLNWIDSL